MRQISKQVFLAARSCMTLGWHTRAETVSASPSQGELFRAEQGRQIGELARQLSPDGLLISDGGINEAAASTQAAMADTDVDVLFEAAFIAGSYVARADILKRDGSSWEVHEVKMSLADTEDLAELVDDLAYTVAVIRRSGVVVSRACLLLVSRACRKGSPAHDIFVEVDQTAEVESRVQEFDELWPTVEAATEADAPPLGRLTCACRGCEFFDSHCLGKGVEDHIFHLPNLHSSKIAKLGNAGVISISAIPADFALTDGQERAVACIKSKQSYIGSSFKSALSKVERPINYLDFESVATALPLYDGVAPYEPIVTQYSVHRCSEPGHIVAHAEYLADAERDCQRELAERLLVDVGETGSVIVYSPFESVRITALADRFADLADPLLRLKARLVDLLPIVRAGFYHHELRGSFSIKRLLPAVVPAMSYEGLAICDGDAAVAQFARMALAQYDPLRVQQVRYDLLAYCAQDTAAMVALHAALLRCS